MKKVKKNGKLLFFEKQDNDKLIYEQKKVHVFMLYFIDVNQGKEYTCLLYTSHISPESAEVQIPTVAKNSGLSEEEVKKIVEENTEKKTLGVFGEERVNVLGCNLDIAAAMGK